jgi:flagellar basal body-associated protein FliL
MDNMDNSAVASKGAKWIKIAGIVTLIGVLIAVGRIVLRVFREKPETDSEHHEAA